MCIFATDMRKLLYISVFFLLLASCTDDKEVMPVLERAEAYLPEHPDSAGMLLDSISSRPLGDSSERVRSLYGLLRTMTDAMTGKGVTTDSLIRPAYIYYKEQGESDEHTRRLGRSAFYLAQFEASRDSTKRAEDLFREAIRCSEQVEDWRTCYMAYNHFASTITWSNTELAIELRKKAIDIYNRCKDKPANLISILNFLCNDYIFVGFADSAFDCANDAYQIACDEQLEQKKYASLRVLSNLYFETGNYPTALELAKQGMYGLNDKTRDASLFSLADCYLACDSMEQAKTTLLNIHSSNPKMQYAVYRKLSQIAIQLHDAPSAIAYSDSLETATVGMFTNIQQTKDEYYQETLKKELQNERQRLSALRQRIIFGICVFALILTLLGIVGYIIYRRYQGRLQRYVEIQNSRRYIAEQNRIKKEQAMQIDANKKIIHQKSITMSLLQKHFLHHLAELRTDLVDAENIKMTQEIWREIEDTLNAADNGFVKKLRSEHKSFDEEDIQLCMLVRMKVPNRNIAQIFLLGTDAIKKRRQKLKREGFKVMDNDVTLDEIIEKYH